MNKEYKEKEIVVLKVPFGGAGAKKGSEEGSEALIKAGFTEILQSNGCHIQTVKTVEPQALRSFPVEGNIKHAQTVEAWTLSVKEDILKSLNDGLFPFILGGDHSLSFGSVLGEALYARKLNKSLYVLWIDAHADFNTPLTSETGNMHGMPTAYLCGLGGFGDFLKNEEQALLPENLILLGTRDIDKEEALALTKHRIKIISMEEIHKGNGNDALESILKKIQQEKAVLHVSFDIDFFDPSIAPGTGTPVAEGATREQGEKIMSLLNQYDCVISCDLVEINPLLDVNRKSARLLSHMATILLKETCSEEAFC